jgi:transposase
LRVDVVAVDVIQAPKLEHRITRYELSDNEWTAIKPNKPRGVRRVNDRRVLNGIFWVLRSDAPWRDLPETYGPRTTCCNRFVRWRRAGVWDQIMDALAAGHDAAVQMIDTSVVRVHQHGACIADNNHQDMGRSRGGLTSKIHAVVDTNGLPVHLALTPGEAHDKSAVFGSPLRLASADDVTHGSWIRRGLDQGACPSARGMRSETLTYVAKYAINFLRHCGRAVTKSDAYFSLIKREAPVGCDEAPA